MLSGDGLLCRMSGARTGIAPNVIRAFPAREDGVLSSGGRTQISGRRVIQNVAPPREGAHALVRPPCSFLSDGGTTQCTVREIYASLSRVALDVAFVGYKRYNVTANTGICGIDTTFDCFGAPL
jgi:hypothetical protein